MSISLAARGTHVVLLDIEGTTTPIAFVHDTLFPYARRYLRAYLEDPAHHDDVAAVARLLGDEHATDRSAGELESALLDPQRPAPDAIAAYCAWLMDRDRKSPGLKLLQGLIWERGYQAGELRGQVFDDVPGAMRRWHDAGIEIAIYSSGSALTQRRLFESPAQGDLSRFISAYFDTSVGAKVDRRSYDRIAETLKREPRSVLFLSDVTRELHAARAAGLGAVLTLRAGNASQADAAAFDCVRSFDEIV